MKLHINEEFYHDSRNLPICYKLSVYSAMTMRDFYALYFFTFTLNNFSTNKGSSRIYELFTKQVNNH